MIRKLFFIVMTTTLLLNGTLLAQDTSRPVITRDNVHQVVQLARLGRGIVHNLAYSQDGETLIVTSSIGIWLYDMADLTAEPRLLEDPDRTMVSFALSTDGTLFATGSRDGIVRLWDVESGQQLAEFETEAEPIYETELVYGVTFSPDGTRLAARAGRTISIWDVPARQIHTLIEEPATWFSRDDTMLFSPDGTLLAMTTPDGVLLWDVGGQEISDFRSFWSIYRSSLLFSPDGTHLAARYRSSNLRVTYDPAIVWDLESRDYDYRHFSGTDHVNHAVFSPSGSMFAYAAGEVVTVRDLDNGLPPIEFTDHTAQVLHVAFSADETTIAAITIEGTIRVWNIETGQQQIVLESYSDWRTDRPFLWGDRSITWVASVAFSPDGETLASASMDGSVRVWNVETGQQRAVLEGYGADIMRRTGLPEEYSEDIPSVDFSPDGNTIATGSFDHTIRLWDTNSMQQTAHLYGHTYYVWQVRFSPDGTLLASGSSDDTARLWDIASGQQRFQFTLEPAIFDFTEVVDIDFSPTGSLLAVSFGAGDRLDGSILLVDVETGQRHPRFEVPSGARSLVDFSPDGSRLAAITVFGRIIRVWDTESGRVQTEFSLDRGWFETVLFSHDWRFFVFTREDYTVWLWDLEDDEPRYLVDGSVRGGRMILSPDSRILATERISRINLWNVESGEQRSSLEVSQSILISMAFSPDSTLFASSQRDDYAVRLWDVDTGQQLALLESHPAFVRFSPDGTLILTAGQGVIRFWGIPEGDS